MKDLRFSSNFLAATLLALLFTSVASAVLPSRTWVSRNGLNSNPCSETSPCRTFAGALSKTAAGGEINCIDAGEYGDGTDLNITKAITIDCDGTFGSILFPAFSNGIDINAGASDVVTLRNLSISTASGTDAGIDYFSAAAVHVENVRISGSTFCIEFASNGASLLTVDNATLSDCGTGISVATGSGNAVVNINNTRITSATGISAGQNAKVTVTRSLIANGAGPGITQSSGGSQVFITGSIIASMGTALRSSAGNFIGASGNTFASNGMVYDQNGGQIYTGNDNPAFGNGPVGSTSGAVPKL